MSLYVIDTDTVTLHRQGHALVSPRILSTDPKDLAVTVMTIDEELSGWYGLLRKAKQPKQLAYAYQQLAESVAYFSGWQILSFPEAAIARYDQLAAMKLNIRKMDLRIAAITLENNGIVVTWNFSDFKR